MNLAKLCENLIIRQEKLVEKYAINNTTQKARRIFLTATAGCHSECNDSEMKNPETTREKRDFLMDESSHGILHYGLPSLRMTDKRYKLSSLFLSLKLSLLSIKNSINKKSLRRFLYNVELFTYAAILFSIEAFALLFLETKDSFLIFANRHRMLGRKRGIVSSRNDSDIACHSERNDSGVKNPEAMPTERDTTPDKSSHGILRYGLPSLRVTDNIAMTEDRGQSFPYSYARHKQMVGRVRFFTKSAFACILVSTVLVSSIFYFLLPGKPNANAATFNFVQSAWDTAADTVNFAKHPDNQNNWTKFFAKDELVNTGNNISLSTMTGNWTQTTDTDFNATGKIFDDTQVSGSGDSASVVPSGAYLGPDSNPYLYRKAVTIQNNVAQTLSDYQVRFTIDTAALIAAGKMKSNTCNDVRFAEMNGANFYYWVDPATCNTDSTVVYVKTDLASSASKDIYFYYGNTTVGSGASGSNVFDFFDDFEGISVGSLGNWTTQLTGIFNGGTSAFVVADVTSSSKAMSTALKQNTPWSSGTIYTTKSSLNIPAGNYIYNFALYTVYGHSMDSSSKASIMVNGTERYKAVGTSGGVWEQRTFTYNSTAIITSLSYGQWANIYIANPNFRYDNVLLRKYAAIEPTISFGTESAGYYTSSPHLSSSGVVYGNLAFSKELTVSAPGAEDVPSSLQFQLRAADDLTALASATWYGPTGTGDYYTTTDTAINPIHNGHKYIQYKAIITNTATALNDITIGIDSTQTLTSSPYNTGTSAVFSDLRWTQTTPDGNSNGDEVRFQLRSTVDQNGAPKEDSWTDWMGPDGSDINFYINPAGGAVIPDILKNGGQWVQYKLYLKGVSQSPTVDDVTLEYVLNAQPQVSVTSASQASTGEINASYTVTDADPGDHHTAYISAYLDSNLNEDLTALDQTALTVTNINNFLTSGTVLIDSEMIAYTGKSGNDLTGLTRFNNNTTVSAHALNSPIYILGKTTSGDIGTIGDSPSFVDHSGNPIPKSISWNIAADLPGVYLANTAKIKISVNDGNHAFQLGAGDSAVLDMLDTQVPIVTSLVVNGTLVSDNVTLSVSDDDPNFRMKASTIQSDLDSPSDYATYTPTVTVNLNAQSTIYFRFIDWKNNVTNYTANIPVKVLNPIVQDVSNSNASQYRLFVSFSPISEPIHTFDGYHLYTSDSQAGDYTEITPTTLNTLATNYYMDDALIQDQTKYYKIAAADDLGNYSALSDAAFGIANGYEDSGEGAGGNQTPPVITHDPSSQLTNITASTATVSFTTDKSSDSIVQFSTDTSYTQNQGTITFISTGTTHSVTLIGLGENTKYYYKIISHDVNASTGTLENVETQTFTTITDNTAPLIGDIGSSADEVSATVRFKTDEGAKGTIHYGTVDGVYPDAFTETSYNFDHSVVLTNLLPGTPYFYTIEAEDNSLLKNKSTSPRQNFMTLASSDTVAPVISNVNVGAVTYNSAVITFSTNENANSVIEFGKDHYLGQIIEGSLSERVTAHSVMLVGLVPNSVYYFKPKALDATGNIGQTSAVYTLTTIAAPNPPAGSLAITNIGITNITSTGATVAWTTNDSSDSVVGYSLDTSYTEVAGSTTLANVHSVTLQNLAPDSVYNLKLISENQSGQVAEATQNGGQNITVSTLSGGDKISPVLTFDPTVQIENITSARATISWMTNENSNTLIDYSKNLGVFTSTQGRYKDNLIVHRFTLTNLEPETAYYFQLRSEDPAGNGVRDNNAGVGYTFTTATAQDTKAPIIDDISVTSTSSTIATITWTTDKPASSLVDFGVTNTYGITQGNAGELVQGHTVTLIGLTPNTAYLFRVKSIDENGNQGMDNNGGRSYTFTTASIQNPGDTTLPAITFNPATGITNITSTTALISWTTDKPSTSDIGYSLDASFAQEQGAFNLTTNHQVSLIDLAPSTLYHFQIKSQDESGNLGINSNSSAGYTFTTLAGADRIPPVITNVKVDAIAGTLATVSWNTNENASSLVEYGTNKDQLSSTAGNYTERVTAHSVAVSNLLPLTTYYFRVRSQDGSKNTSVDDGGDTPYTFITLGSEDVCPVYSGGGGGGSSQDVTPPKISNVKIDSIVDTGAVVTWDTDKGGYSIVEYSTDKTFDNSVFWGNPKKMEQKHSVKIIGLSATTTYYYRPLSADSSGNLAQAEGMNFATSVAVENPIDKPTDNPIDKPTDKPAAPTQTLQQQTEDKIQELVQSGFTEEEIKQIVANFSSPFKITSESPKVSDITNNSAKINWMTDKKTNGVVQFRVKGNSNAPVKEFGIFNELDFSHNVILANLDSGITYEFLAQSSDVLGNTFKSDWYSFTTNTTPSIYDVAISGVNLSSATVEWKTNIPSSDELEYGLSINYGNKFESKVNEKTIAHIVKLNNLESGKTYHYRIKGIDTNGNILSSDDYTLTTYTLPQVQNYSIVSINEREAVISWTTNVETDSTVKYTDTKTDEVKSQGEDALAKTHNFNLKGLEPGVDYIIQIQGRDSYGNQAVSSEFSLKTLADTTPPAFGRVNIETAVSQGKDSQVRTIISYTTSEPATTQILYGQGADDNQYSQSTPLDENLTTNHVIVVTDFKSATVYKFKLQAKDGAGNIQDSQDFTVLVPEEKKSVIQMISQNLENTFGWLKKLKG